MVNSFSVVFSVVLALMASNAQDIPEASTEITEPRQLQGVVSVVQSIIQTIQEITDGIRSFIGDLISNLIGRIRDVITSIPGNVIGLTTRLGDIARTAGESGRQCIQTQRDLITDLVFTMTNGTRRCVSEAQTKIQLLRDQLAVLIGKVTSVQQDLTNKVAKCIQDSLLNPLFIMICLTDQIGPARIQVFGVETEMLNTFKIAKQTAYDASTGLSTCVALVKVDMTRRQIRILGAATQCVSNLVG